MSDLPKFEALPNIGNLVSGNVSFFNEGYNLYQCLNYLQGYVSIVYNSMDELLDDWNNFQNVVNENIDKIATDETQRILNQWLDDGTLANIIRELLGGDPEQFNERITDLENGKSKVVDGNSNFIDVAQVTPNGNLLDNSEFINGVINQQGLNTYTNEIDSEVKMGIDRWLFSRLGVINIGSGYVNFQSTTLDCWFSQRIYIDPTGKTLTFSVKIKDQDIISKTVHNINVDKRLDLINDENVSIYIEYDDHNRLYAWIYLKKPHVSLNVEFLKLEYGNHFSGLGKWNQTNQLLNCQYRYCEMANVIFVLIDGNLYFATNSTFPVSMAKLPKITYGEIKNLSGQTLQITPNFEGRFNLRAIETVQFLESVPENASIVIFSKIIADSNEY